MNDCYQKTRGILVNINKSNEHLTISSVLKHSSIDLSDHSDHFNHLGRMDKERERNRMRNAAYLWLLIVLRLKAVCGWWDDSCPLRSVLCLSWHPLSLRSEVIGSVCVSVPSNTATKSLSVKSPKCLWRTVASSHVLLFWMLRMPKMANQTFKNIKQNICPSRWC